MAASASGAGARRRGPAPIASFDHDVSDESSPETKQSFRLPEIREDPAVSPAGPGLAPPEPRARSHSTPAATALAAPPAPRIDISRASSSSHHDSRDSSPELALFAGSAEDDARATLDLGFREDGALDLRSSTEELAFLEPAPGEASSAPAPARAGPGAPPPPPAERRHSRKDSQSSEAALLAVSGRTSRLSSVGSQCSAQSALSALSRVSRLSVVSGASRSPSPHRMLLETSFCGPKPIETDPEISAGALVEQILGITKVAGAEAVLSPPTSPATVPTLHPAGCTSSAAPIDARDRREVRTEVTVESARSAPVAPTVTVVAPPPTPTPEPSDPASVDAQKNDKETKNRTRTEDRKARPRLRREPSEPEVYKSRNKSKNIIRIKLKPDESYGEEEESERPSVSVCASAEAARKPVTLELAHAARPAEPAPPSPAPSPRRSPSPAGPPVSRKSSFCSLFKSRETIASPESPSGALRRKRSLTEGRSRSKSRDRSSTPTSTSKIRGSVLSLFRTPRRSGASPSPGSREGSPVVQLARSLNTTTAPSMPPTDRRRADKLKYYDDTKDGIIHIPLRTPPEEQAGISAARRSSGSEPAATVADVTTHHEPRPASAPQPRPPPDQNTLTESPLRSNSEQQPRVQPAPPTRIRPEPLPRIKSDISQFPTASHVSAKPIHRTVLPDGSIIIPLHSPTERPHETSFPETVREDVPVVIPKINHEPIEVPGRIESSTTVTSETRSGAPPTPSPLCDSAESHLRATPVISAQVEPPSPSEDTRKRRKERLIFTTHVGSHEQVFSTQFSITKTPSVTSEISGSFPSFTEGEEVRAPALRDTHIAAEAGTPQDPPRDSSESEPSSEAAPSRTGNDVERRGLVVQESFEEELPYVPTTLPQERSVALPMVPVRERGGVRVSGVQRPRAAAPPAARAPAPPPAPLPASAPPAADKLRIKLPRRPRAPSAPSATGAGAERPRTRSGDDSGSESRSKQEWIDFEEVPERRKQPKRIQTLPAGAVSGGAGGVVFSYVEPEHCRCECHGHRADDQLPLLRDDMQGSRISSSSAECGDEESNSQIELGVHIARPFTADLDVQPERHVNTETARQ